LSETGKHKALVLAPQGRDAQVAISLLSNSSVAGIACRDIAGVSDRLEEDIAFLLATEEALIGADLRPLADWLANQPSWSDLPIIVLTHAGGGPDRNPEVWRLAKLLRNVSFIERPFNPMTLASIVSTAIGSRERQFEAKARIEELAALNGTLERRVRERTADLERSHAIAMEEARQREKAEEQLLQAQKVEAIGQLTGGVAHDFNNLLMAILGNLEMLRKHVAGDEKATRLIEGAFQGANRGASLTQRLLAFARRQDLQIKVTNIGDLVRSLEGLLSQSIGPGVDLRIQIEDTPLRAEVDINQIELALLNLVINSRDAMPDGGTIAVDVGVYRASAEADLADGDYVAIVVTDSGRGMDSATLRRAVEPFFSTKGVGKGTGLGLSMIHGLALQLNGALRLTSKAGKGTTASLLLPAIVDDRTDSPEPMLSPVVTSSEAARSHILVVDDDALIAMSTVDMIEDLGHRVLEAHSGSKALEIIESDVKIDLMITDYAMPRMTGADLILAARRVRPDLPVVLASGYADLPGGTPLDVPRLNKPYDQRQLEVQINKALAG
jgi:signal transduction histidine kinase/CheY-like chemotaxis protein